MDINCVCGKTIDVNDIDNHKKRCPDYLMIIKNVMKFDNLSKTVAEFKSKLKSFQDSYDNAKKQIDIDELFPDNTVEAMVAKLGEKSALKIIKKVSKIDVESVKKWLDKKKFFTLSTATLAGGMAARTLSLVLFGGFNTFIIFGGSFGLTTVVAIILNHLKGNNASKSN